MVENRNCHEVIYDHLRGKVYAIGGCDKNEVLNTIECMDISECMGKGDD